MNRWEKQQGNVEANPSVSLAGCLVVASPSLTDGLFGRSVCIVVEHTPERAIGIVLNKRLDADLQPIWEHIFEGESDSEGNSAESSTRPSAGQLTHVNFGGPTSGPIVAIHKERELAEGGNDFGVYLAAESEHLKQLALTHGVDYRLFIGHAVWGPKELEKQVVEGSWHVLPAVPELVFADEAIMWQQGMRAIGNDVIHSITGLPAAEIIGTLN